MSDLLIPETFQTIVNCSVDAVVVINEQGDIVFWNQAAELMFGYSEAEVLGVYVHDILPARHLRGRADKAFLRFKHSGEAPALGKILHVQGRRKSGQEFDVQFSLKTVRCQGKLITYAFLRDISELIGLQKKLQNIANTDSLTGLLNRRAFTEQTDKTFSHAQRHDFPLALMMLDIDFFKRINDSFGHAAGDSALQHFADTVSATIRQEDIFGRVGGEEFCLLLPSVSAEQGLKVAEKIRAAIAAQTLSLDNTKIKMTVSIGLSYQLPADRSLAEIQQRADKALYEAKDSGRNRVAVQNGA